MKKEHKGYLIVPITLCALFALEMTEWGSGHPIGSFAESFVAAALMLASFLASAIGGFKTAERLSKSSRFYRFSTFAGWIVGLAILLACLFAMNCIPGISEALDRLPESSDY